ncbi:MAG: hypothetical protein V4808_06680 [Pseudomonadota bacterium]
MQFLSIQNFAGAANQEFEISMGESAMSVTLIEVKPLPAQPYPGMRREPFSLLFKSASKLILPQRQYKMTHPDLGSHDIFLVAIAQDQGNIVYQAVYN